MLSPQLIDDVVAFNIPSPTKGLWSNKSILSMPEGFTPVINNFDLDGGIPVSMKGDADFIATAWPNDGGVLNLITYHRSAAGVNTYIIATTAGIIYKWTGAAWAILRQGLDTTATLWWAAQRYGTDLYLSNPTDGIYKYDGDTLTPVGSKPIAQMESDEAALWAGETADTANFREGLQSMYVESAGAQTSMVFTPAANFNASAGRGSARAYESDKSPGTDFYHFKVRFTDAGTNDTTNTRVLLTDGSGNTLNFPFTTWDSDRAGTTFAISLNNWQDVYLPALGGTETGAFVSSNIDTFTFSVDTSAGTLRMAIDDFYVIYATSMPAVNYLGEWRNILWGATPTALYFSPENAPDEFNVLATFAIKSNGDLITGMKNFFNQLIITTETQVHSISGQVSEFAYPGYLFDQNMVTDEIGNSSHRSMVKAAEKLYWWFNTQIVEFDGTNARKISYPIDSFLLDSEQDTKQFFVGAPFRVKNQVWWTYRRNGQSTNDIIIRFDYILQAFLPCLGLTTPLLTQVYDGSEEYLLSANTTTRLVKKQGQTGVFTFSGVDIAYSIEFPPAFVPGLASEWATAELLYFTNTGSLTVSFRIADHLRELAAAAYATAETVNMAAAGEYGKIRFGDRARFFQLRLVATAVLVELEFPITLKTTSVLGLSHNRVTP